ncbi:MAG: type V CRISPR-associated protein Cpf1, partial [Candidatus Margulisbacteria bacterium]|nr:type V CRISPR-associated protein Cpf1 [Candidatus Margulisiibacteriota bacterium]
MSEKIFDNFIGRYSLAKTLRFELKPVGETLENIEKSDILAKDKHRAESYKKVKKIIDEYHKDFIEKSLSKCLISKDDLMEYKQLFCIKNKAEDQKKTLEKIQTNLRKQIVKCFDTKRLFGQELLSEDLPRFIAETDLAEFYAKENLSQSKAMELIGEFKKFTTYFRGFNENRKNMYSAEDKSTAISYRLINDNLPKYIVNIAVFEKNKTALADKIKILQSDLRAKLNGANIADFFTLEYYGKILT